MNDCMKSNRCCWWTVFRQSMQMLWRQSKQKKSSYFPCKLQYIGICWDLPFAIVIAAILAANAVYISTEPPSWLRAVPEIWLGAFWCIPPAAPVDADIVCAFWKFYWFKFRFCICSWMSIFCWLMFDGWFYWKALWVLGTKLLKEFLVKFWGPELPPKCYKLGLIWLKRFWFGPIGNWAWLAKCLEFDASLLLPLFLMSLPSTGSKLMTSLWFGLRAASCYWNAAVWYCWNWPAPFSPAWLSIGYISCGPLLPPPGLLCAFWIP